MTTIRRAAPLLCALLILSTSGVRAAGAQDIDMNRIDASIERMRTEARVPGMSLAIVHRDSVVHARGFGVREVGSRDSVDTQTLFAIGSATKSFTAAAVAALIDDGVLNWDDRVRNRLPAFALRDPYVTSEITIRDLLAHRSGLPPANLMWLSAREPADTVIHRLRELEQAAPFRSGFFYQNLLYLVAGRIIESAAERKWDDFLADRILHPLGMMRTNSSVRTLTHATNVATPHVVVDGDVRVVPYRDIDMIGPAGSLNSTAADLAQWLRLLLGSGEFEGTRLFETSTFQETWTPQTIVPADAVMRAFHPSARLQAYGMGWFLSDFHGSTLVTHGGGIDGMSALVAWIPEEELGVAILTNLQPQKPPVWLFGMLYEVLDMALGIGPTDWETPAQTLEDLLSAEAQPDRAANTHPSLQLSEYVGNYANEVLGLAEISQTPGGLLFTLGVLRGVLEHWHYDTFRLRWDDDAFRSAAGYSWVTFRIDYSGSLEVLEFIAAPGDVSLFVRQND